MEENQNISQNQEVEGQKNTNSLLWIGVGLIVLVIIGGFALTRKGDTSEKDVLSESTVEGGVAMVNENQLAETATNEQENSGVTIVNVEAGSFYYKPNEIRVKKGQKVKIVMTSMDMMHDFNVDELGIKLPITKAGNTGEVEFSVNQSGSFEYYCSVGQHRKNGQVGKLIVE